MTTPRARGDRAFGHRWVRSPVAGIPGQFWWLWSGTLITRLGYFVQPFLVLYLTAARHLPDGQAGLALSAFGAGCLVSQPLGGLLADRLGERRALVIGLTASAATLLALGAATSEGAILACAALAGCCLDLYRPASQALVADMVGPEARPRAYALLYWAVNLGYAVAAAAGFLARSGFWLLFALDAATTLIFAALIAGRLGRNPGSAQPRRHARRGSLRGAGYGRVAQDRLLLAFTAVTTLYAIVYLQAGVTLPLAVRAAGLPVSAFGLVISLNGALIVIVQPLTVQLLDRVNRTCLLAASQLVVGAGFALTALCHATWQFAGAVAVWTLGEIGAAGTVTAVVTDLAPAGLRGRYLGLAGAAWGAASMLAPLAGTTVLQAAPGVL